MGRTTPDMNALANRFAVHESVIENLYEEYEFESELYAAFDAEVSFEEFLMEEFAQAHYMIEAIQKKGDAIACLEAYDTFYTHE